MITGGFLIIGYVLGTPFSPLRLSSFLSIIPLLIHVDAATKIDPDSFYLYHYLILMQSYHVYTATPFLEIKKNFPI